MVKAWHVLAVAMGVLFILVGLGVVGCTAPAAEPAEPEHRYSGTGGCGGAGGGEAPELSGASPCEKACRTLQRLGCEEGEPTPKGTPCAEVCEDAAAEGIDLGVRCVARAATCEEARRCR